MTISLRTLLRFLLPACALLLMGTPTYAQSDADTLRTTGLVSYYADDLAGNPTASGQPYDPDRLTASHRTLPFGTRVRVTRTYTGKEVVVRINDRGPKKEERILDLSQRAAEELEMIDAGIVEVEIEVIEEPEE